MELTKMRTSFLTPTSLKLTTKSKYQQVIKNGHFKFELDSIDAFCYVQLDLVIPNNDDMSAVWSKRPDVWGICTYILEPSDHIRMNINDTKNIIYSGKGINKFIVQDTISKLSVPIVRCSNCNIFEKLKKEKSRIDSIVNVQSFMLQKIKDSTSSLAYQLLMVDNWSAVNSAFLENLQNKFFGEDFSQFSSFYIQNVTNNQVNTSDLTIKTWSRTFYRYVYDREMGDQLYPELNYENN